MRNKGILAESLLWLYKFFLLTIVAIGLVFIVSHSSVKVDKNSIYSSIILTSLEEYQDINRINCDNSFFIGIKNENLDLVCGNSDFKALCELKDVELKHLYCKKTKIVFKNKVSDIVIGLRK